MMFATWNQWHVFKMPFKWLRKIEGEPEGALFKATMEIANDVFKDQIEPLLNSCAVDVDDTLYDNNDKQNRMGVISKWNREWKKAIATFKASTHCSSVSDGDFVKIMTEPRLSLPLGCPAFNTWLEAKMSQAELFWTWVRPVRKVSYEMMRQAAVRARSHMKLCAAPCVAQDLI